VIELKQTVEFSPSDIAKVFADANSGEQAQLLNLFSERLSAACKERLHLQIAYIAEDLDEDGWELVERLMEFREAGQ